MLPRLRPLLLLFWASWLSVVTLSNLTNALRVAGWLPSGWAFASSNFQLIEASTSIYSCPKFIVWLLFVGVILWEGLAAGLFWRAVAVGKALERRQVELAFGAAVGLFAAFMVSDELLVSYSIQASHMRIFTALLVSFLVLRAGEKEQPGADG